MYRLAILHVNKYSRHSDSDNMLTVSKPCGTSIQRQMHHTYTTGHSSEQTDSDKKRRCNCRIRDGLVGPQGMAGSQGLQGAQGATGITGPPASISPAGALMYAIDNQPLPSRAWYQVLFLPAAFSYNTTTSPTGITVLAGGVYTICWALAIRPVSDFLLVVTVDGLQAGSSSTFGGSTSQGLSSVSGSSVQRVDQGQEVCIFIFNNVSTPLSIINSMTLNGNALPNLSYLSVTRILE